MYRKWPLPLCIAPTTTKIESPVSRHGGGDRDDRNKRCVPFCARRRPQITVSMFDIVTAALNAIIG